MSFLSPWTIAIAAGLTVPPLVALYFLKLKRQVRLVPTTLLWKKSVEDLQVNSPFQRLRSSLLLMLQLLVLLLGAFALGQPMFKHVEMHDDTLILMIDQSASMNVVEADGRTRLEEAKVQARAAVDNMSPDGRAMVIAFCDRATVASSFDSDKSAVKRKIDSIESTQSTTTLGEAMSLAEAYTQKMVIGGVEAGSDIASDAPASPATVFLFTDGRIEDSHLVALQEFQTNKLTVTSIGQRGDNVGILAMEAGRNHERPEILEVAARVRNFGPAPVTVDAVLYVDGRNVDVQTLQMAGAPSPEKAATDSSNALAAAPHGASDANDFVVAVFDNVEFAGEGVVEVMLRVDDALPADDRAWTLIPPPRPTRVLLVTGGNMFLEQVLSVLPIDVVTMTAEQYESAPESELLDGERISYDVVIFDRHSTARLPKGNYFFWGSIPKINGVALGDKIANQVIFNWDETHPVLRHVGVETLFVYEWQHLTLPREALNIIEGETSPVLSHLSRDGSQFMISAFALIADDESGNAWLNTDWVKNLDFVVFMQNAVPFLASNAALAGRKTLRPGEPITAQVPKNVERVSIERPNNERDDVQTGGSQTIHYARTRNVGLYRVKPGISGEDSFAVNLFNSVESNVAPAAKVTIGAESVASKRGEIPVNLPAWPYVVLAMLGVLLLEWIVYNRRVFI